MLNHLTDLLMAHNPFPSLGTFLSLRRQDTSRLAQRCEQERAKEQSFAHQGWVLYEAGVPNSTVLFALRAWLDLAPEVTNDADVLGVWGRGCAVLTDYYSRRGLPLSVEDALRVKHYLEVMGTLDKSMFFATSRADAAVQPVVGGLERMLEALQTMVKIQPSRLLVLLHEAQWDPAPLMAQLGAFKDHALKISGLSWPEYTMHDVYIRLCKSLLPLIESNDWKPLPHKAYHHLVASVTYNCSIPIHPRYEEYYEWRPPFARFEHAYAAVPLDLVYSLHFLSMYVRWMAADNVRAFYPLPFHACTETSMDLVAQQLLSYMQEDRSCGMNRAQALLNQHHPHVMQTLDVHRSLMGRYDTWNAHLLVEPLRRALGFGPSAQALAFEQETQSIGAVEGLFDA